MFTHACPPAPAARRIAGLRRAFTSGMFSCTCLLAVVPAARAYQDPGRPEPETIWWGLLCLIVALTYVLIACFRAPLNAQPRYQPRRAPRLKSRLTIRRASPFATKIGGRVVSWFSHIVTADLRQHPGRPRPSWTRRPKMPKTNKKP